MPHAIAPVLTAKTFGNRSKYHAAVTEALEPRILFSVPSVDAISRATSSWTNASSVAYIVTFDQPVTGVTSDTFSLTTSGVTGASIGAADIVGQGNTYMVTVHTGSGDGTLGLNVVADSAVKNSAQEALTAGVTGPVYAVQRNRVQLDGTASNKNIASGTPTFTGTVVPAASATVTVKIYAGSTTTGTPVATLTTTPNSDGSYSVSVPSEDALTDGSYTADAAETDANGDSLPDNKSPLDISLYPPDSPTGLNATPVSSSEIDLSWDAPESGDPVSNYAVYISTDGGASFTLYENVGPATKCNVTGLRR